MSGTATLDSVDVDPRCQDVARSVLGGDPRVSFVLEDGMAFIRRQPPGSYDLIFADAMAGKYEGLSAALALVKPGGFYVGDDMLARPDWPLGHKDRVAALVAALAAMPGWVVTMLACGSGVVLAVRK